MTAWEDRFRAPRWSVPTYARDRPERCLLAGNPGGTWELFSWVADGEAAASPRQLTHRAEGTVGGQLDPTGTWAWWFDDHAGDEFGVWRRQSFGSDPGTDTAAAPGVPAGYAAGLALGASGQAVIGTSDDSGTQIFRVAAGDPAADAAQLIYHHREDAQVVDLDRGETRLLISHSEHGDSRHPALRVLTLAGDSVAELWDGPGKALDAVQFSPAGDAVLALHERRGRSEPLLWWPERGTGGAVEELAVDLAGELSAQFFPDAAALLVIAEHRGRRRAYRYDLGDHQLSELGGALTGGTLSGALTRPGATVWADRSSGAEPPLVVELPAARPLLAPPPGPAAPAGVAVTDVEAEGPGGSVHALVSLPAGGPRPLAAVFLVHGGPTWHDSDCFDPGVAAWVDHGYAVVRVNYRGSTGYGSCWRDALEASPGLVELADVAAVRDHLVAAGTVDGGRCVIAGGSWGGFLTLLALGTQPQLWAAGVAAVPVADYEAAYADEMEGLKAFDRSLFGGSPDEVPEAYRRASPLTYIGAVRAPVLVLAGENDPRCPIRQVENYLVALQARGAAHEVYRFDAGHGSLVVEERIRQLARELEFVRRHVPAGDDRSA